MSVAIKKRAYEIFVEEGSIPPDEDIYKLCSYGFHKKISLINKSYFTEEVKNTYITFMKNKMKEIETWKSEEENNNEKSLKRLNKRIWSIKKTINVVRNFNKDSNNNSFSNTTASNSASNLAL
jgi:hypothetical protein